MLSKNDKIRLRIEEIRHQATVCGPEVAMFLTELNEERRYVKHLIGDIGKRLHRGKDQTILQALDAALKEAAGRKMTKPVRARDRLNGPYREEGKMW